MSEYLNWSTFAKGEYHWVKCKHCNCDIERSVNLGNRTFACLDCKEERRRKCYQEWSKNNKRSRSARVPAPILRGAISDHVVDLFDKEVIALWEKKVRKMNKRKAIKLNHD